MWRQDHVGEIPQWVGGVEGLRVEHLEPSPREATAITTTPASSTVEVTSLELSLRDVGREEVTQSN